MTQRTNPPFRADHVGSLLRPAELHEARDKARRGAMSADTFRALQDRHIRDVVAGQEKAGMQAVTDGEFRRDWWHIDFLAGFDGVTLSSGDAYGDAKFKGTDEQPPFMLVTRKIRRTKPSMLDHFKFLKSIAKRTPKFTMPSPAMLHARADRASLKKTYPDVDEFWADLTKAYREEIADLYKAGCRYLQIDDTTIAMMGDPKVQENFRKLGDDPKKDNAMYADAVNAAIRDVPDDMTVECRRILPRVRHRPRRRLRAPALRPEGEDRGARPGQLQGSGTGEEGRPETPHRRRGEIHSAGEPVPQPAVRVLEHPPRQQAHRRRSVAQAGTVSRHSQERLGLAHECARKVHSGLIPAAFTSGHHFSVSAL